MIIGFVQYQHSSVQLVLEMDRNAKLRTTLGTTNIHQQSSPLNYHKYREIHYNIGKDKNGGQQNESSAESNIFLKKNKSGKNEECTVTVKTAIEH